MLVVLCERALDYCYEINNRGNVLINVELRRFRLTNVAAGNQEVLRILSVCL
jgi:hypothetical protein